MKRSQPPPSADLIDKIPDPDTVRNWLADSLRLSDLLRALLRLARRKAAYHRPDRPPAKETPPRQQ